MIRLQSEFSPTWMEIDPRTGLPNAIGSLAHGRSLSLAARIVLILGGAERRGPFGDLVYDGAASAGDLAATGGVTATMVRGARVFSIPLVVGNWHGVARYAFRAADPAITLTFDWSPAAGAQPMRDFVFELDVALEQIDDWVVNVSGARIRPELPLHEAPEEIAVASPAALASSAGVLAFTETDDRTFIFWPRSWEENGETLLRTSATGITLRHTTGLAGDPGEGATLTFDGIAFDDIAAPWSSVRNRVRNWLADFGVSTPLDRPRWTSGATIYEVQIGTSIFAGGTWTYSPYPDMAALYQDLPRIAGLGFDTLQLMPRQPYPSYNIVDFDDVDLTYGDSAELRRVIEWCHAHGMKVILDVLMHGLIDRESIREVAASVRGGPWNAHFTATAESVAALRLTAKQQEQLSWSRHIIDFEREWHDNSPERHPLADVHPDWFCRDTSGKIIGVYTKAFDQSHPEWHRYFTDAMVRLVETLGVDGFRFDAPGYNRFPNWSPRTRSRASLQELGAMTLFPLLRRRLHELDPNLMLYTEPNGALWRQSMDLNYNYDETWLPDSLFGSGGDHPPSRVRTGRELAAWMRDRDLTLPAGALTAHHIDSHDTFWWPLPGVKWRREQFGSEAAAALMTAFALSGGPYMMFVGGEQGIEDAIGRVNRIRKTYPELAIGVHTFDATDTAPESLFIVRHQHMDDKSITVVNLSPQPVSWTFRSGSGTDRWVDELSTTGTPISEGEQLSFPPFAAKFLVPAHRTRTHS